MSESTVIELKLRSVPRASSRWRSGAGIFASVKTKASIVAMSGAIMPLPLAKPLSRTSSPPMRAVRVAPLGKVSVVMIARAASSHPTSESPACSAGSAAVSRSCGKTSPITPVEARKTCRAGQPTSPAAAVAVAFTASRPAFPENTLALPALTTSARARPALSAARHQSMGAPGQRFCVKTPPTVVPGASSAIIKSARPS